ncbi:hypothetical protein [Nostoc sp.]|uniref:hypothetical protein n=1 Tax=Nostoc sp. TaxID=1180 RepID=UPI002FFC7DE4
MVVEAVSIIYNQLYLQMRSLHKAIPAAILLLRFSQEFMGVITKVDIRGDRLLFNEHRAGTLLNLCQRVLQVESAGERTFAINHY